MRGVTAAEAWSGARWSATESRCHLAAPEFHGWSMGKDLYEDRLLYVAPRSPGEILNSVGAGYGDRRVTTFLEA